MSEIKENCCGSDCGCETKVLDLPVEQPIYLDKIINLDKIEDNSVILFRINEVNAKTYESVEQIMRIFGEQLKNKKCSFLVMTTDSNIELLSEKEMNQLGWFRQKEKSLIIH